MGLTKLLEPHSSKASDSVFSWAIAVGKRLFKVPVTGLGQHC